MTKILDHGYVDLLDKMGDDLRIVNAARQSFGKESEAMGMSEIGLIGFLMKNRHGTPFEHVVFSFNVKCPIFVVREWMRHRIGSFNEYSGRYSKMISDFYVPDEECVRSQSGKPGSYKFEPIEGPKARIFQNVCKANADTAWHWYESMMAAGVAKEQARIMLPVNVYTMFTWTVNLRALFNFMSLRSADNAMYEIRQYSQAIEKLVWDVVPHSMGAWVTNQRIVP